MNRINLSNFVAALRDLARVAETTPRLFYQLLLEAAQMLILNTEVMPKLSL